MEDDREYRTGIMILIKHKHAHIIVLFKVPMYDIIIPTGDRCSYLYMHRVVGSRGKKPATVPSPRFFFGRCLFSFIIFERNLCI